MRAAAVFGDGDFALRVAGEEGRVVIVVGDDVGFGDRTRSERLNEFAE
jgi:hypothetical protein